MNRYKDMYVESDILVVDREILDRQMNRCISTQIDLQIYVYVLIIIGRYIDRQLDKWVVIQIGKGRRQKDRLMYRMRYIVG